MRKLRAQSGYSLVEITVAALILGLILVALTGILRAQGSIQDEADIRRRALNWLTQIAEDSTLFPEESVPRMPRCNALSAIWNSKPPVSLEPDKPSPITGTFAMNCTEITNWDGYSIDHIVRADYSISWVSGSIADTLYLVDDVYNR